MSQQAPARQVVLNATDLTITEVAWPGYPALLEVGTFEADQAFDVMQIHFWSPPMNAWIKLVSAKTGEAGVIEVELGDLEAIRQLEAQGVPKVEAIRRVLGVLPK